MITEDAIRSAVKAHGAVVAAVVTEAKGSSPRDAGTLMLILPDQTLGTIGGGTAEQQVIEAARILLSAPAPPLRLEFPLGPDLDQCCGGHMSVSLGLVDPKALDHSPALLWDDGPELPANALKRSVIIYGAGHVGQAILRALTPLPFQITLVDARPEDGLTPGVQATPLPEAIAEEAGPDTFHLVLTHSHAVDLEIVAAVLRKPFGFCGLIGSATKRTLFERRLSERGIPRETLAELTCPIGLTMLKDKRPEVIAASVAVQLMLRDQILRWQT